MTTVDSLERRTRHYGLTLEHKGEKFRIISSAGKCLLGTGFTASAAEIERFLDASNAEKYRLIKAQKLLDAQMIGDEPDEDFNNDITDGGGDE
jgi:hypothetical protein